MANVQFEKAFGAVAKEVEYKESWANGTGYLDNAVHDRDVEVISKSVCPKGRKIIIIPTLVGNVVVFQRYANDDIIVSNEPPSIQKLVAGLELGGSLGPDALEFYLGTEWGTPHIGERVENFVTLVTKLSK